MTPNGTTTSTKTTRAPRWSSPLRTSDGRLLPTHGRRVCRYINQNFVYGEGDWYGQPVRLRHWQKRFLHRLYEYYPETGQRRFKRAVEGVAKSNGKTPKAAWVGGYELTSGVQDFPHVIVGSGSLKQANIVFGDLRVTLAESPTLSGFVLPYSTEILLKDREGKAERIAAEAGTNDGARCTTFIGDELHEWDGPRRRVYMILDGAIGKRAGAFSYSITTAGVLGDSLACELYDYGVKVAKGEIVDDSFLFEWYEADPDLNLDDPDQLLEAIMQANPAAGDFNSITEILRRFNTIPRHEFRRYHLNQFVAASVEGIIPIESWDACQGAPVMPAKAKAWVGVDGAFSRDSFCIATVVVEDGKTHARERHFDADEELGMDFDAVEDYIRGLASEFEIVECAYDPFAFERSAQILSEEGITMVSVTQDDKQMIPASQAIFDCVMERRLVHDGNATTRAHIEAAVASHKEKGWRLSKRKSKARIDAAIALALAIWRSTVEPPKVMEPSFISLRG